MWSNRYIQGERVIGMITLEHNLSVNKCLHSMTQQFYSQEYIHQKCMCMFIKYLYNKFEGQKPGTQKCILYTSSSIKFKNSKLWSLSTCINFVNFFYSNICTFFMYVSDISIKKDLKKIKPSFLPSFIFYCEDPCSPPCWLPLVLGFQSQQLLVYNFPRSNQ